MKLSDWAKKQNISYATALRWFKTGKLPVEAYQTESGTILIKEQDRSDSTISAESTYLMIYNALPKTVEIIISRNHFMQEMLFELANLVAQNLYSLIPNSEQPEDITIGDVRPSYNRKIRIAKEEQKKIVLENLPEHIELYNNVKDKLNKIYGLDAVEVPVPKDELDVEVLNEILQATQEYIDAAKKSIPPTKEDFELQIELESIDKENKIDLQEIEKLKQERTNKREELTKKLQENKLKIKRSNLLKDKDDAFLQFLETAKIKDSETKDHLIKKTLDAKDAEAKSEGKNEPDTKILFERLEKIEGTDFPLDPDAARYEVLTTQDIKKIQAYNKEVRDNKKACLLTITKPPKEEKNTKETKIKSEDENNPDTKHLFEKLEKIEGTDFPLDPDAARFLALTLEDLDNLELIKNEEQAKQLEQTKKYINKHTLPKYLEKLKGNKNYFTRSELTKEEKINKFLETMCYLNKIYNNNKSILDTETKTIQSNLFKDHEKAYLLTKIYIDAESKEEKEDIKKEIVKLIS